MSIQGHKKLLFVSQYFYPESFRGNDIAFDLARRGMEVTVLCGTPNYPAGKFFKGYGWFKRNKEEINGVKVIRIPIIPRGSSSLTLLLNYLSYAINASFFLLFHLIRNYYDVCFIQQLSPVTIVVPGVLWKKLTGRPLVTWVLDLWPESLQSAGGIKNKYVLNFFGAVAKSEYKNADKILVSSKDFQKSICEKGDFISKITYYPNWAEDSFKEKREVQLPSLPKGFLVMFAGAVGEAQDFDHIVEAAKTFKGSEVKFVILGDGRKKDWVEEQIKKEALQDNLFLLGRYPIEYMPTFFEKADIMLVSLKDELIFNLTVPAKIQAYMSVGKPIIAMINGAGAELVKEAKCGIAVPAENPNELQKAIIKLQSMNKAELAAMGDNGKMYCEQHFSKEKSMEKLYHLLNEELCN